MILKRAFLAGLLCCLALTHPLSAAEKNFRLRYMGSSIISMPTGYLQSQTEYISDDNHSMVQYSQKIMGLVEGSMLRHLGGEFKDQNILNLKVNLLTEDKLIPSVVWGVSDVQTKLGSKVFYLAASKNIEMFGVTIHAGAFKDPVTTKKQPFYGLEKMVLPLVFVVGEHLDGNNSIGMKLRPYPNVDIEIAQRDFGTDHQRAIYKLRYLIPF